MLFIRLAIIAIIYPLICGFTFDYGILSACEKKHPNDFVARMVCNNKLEDEIAVRNCEISQRDSIDSQLQELIVLLDLTYPTKIENMHELLNKRKFNTSLIPAKNDSERRVIAFHLPTECDVGYRLNVNIYERKKDGVAYGMSVWRNDDPKNKSSSSYIVEKYDWNFQLLENLKRNYLAKIEYVTAYEYKEKLVKLEVKKLKKITEIFLNEIETDLTEVDQEQAKLERKFINEVNKKSIIFNATKSDKAKNTIRINSTIFNELNYTLELSVNSDQVKFLLTADSTLEPLYANTAKIPQKTVKEKLNNSKVESTSNTALIVFVTLLIGSLFIFKEQITTYFFTKKTSLSVDESSTNLSETVTKKNSYFGYAETESSNSVPSKPKINHKEFLSEKAFEDFRAKHPFVMVDVDPSLRMQFIEECTWLEKKIGHFPSEKEQLEILNSLTSKKLE
jgi:hypothetical protein